MKGHITELSQGTRRKRILDLGLMRRVIITAVISLATIAFVGAASADDAGWYARTGNMLDAMMNGLIDGEGRGRHSPETDAATRGLVADRSGVVIRAGDRVVWDMSAYSFLREPYSSSDRSLSVAPTLWNNGTNNAIAGLFEVMPNEIYQVRGYDMSNMTFVRLPNGGWLAMDLLMSDECADAALNLFAEHKGLGERFISAVVISHSHVDHFGGIEAVMRRATAPDIPIYAPAGFFEHSVSENVYAGRAMGRRASYQYGSFITPRGEGDTRGSVSIGIGIGQSRGTIGFRAATEEIAADTSRKIGGLTVEFQLTPGTEAPAEMNCYFPELRALWLAENCTGTMHNLYTLRGAAVRDGALWARYLVEADARYAERTDVIFQSHNWPFWPSEGASISDRILDTAAMYKYINDQTLLHLNMGMKMAEAADAMVMPNRLKKPWALKPFYGTPAHNAKAVYQKFIGWYSADPIQLAEMPDELASRETARYLTSGRPPIEMIEADIDAGNFQTAAAMARALALGATDARIKARARELCATALVQMGCMAESGPWRNAYLSAAHELTHGPTDGRPSGSAALTLSMTPSMLLDFISVLYDGERGAGLPDWSAVLRVEAASGPEYFRFHRRAGALLYVRTEPTRDAVRVDVSALRGAILRSQGGDAAAAEADVPTELREVFDLMVDLRPYSTFGIITERVQDGPKRPSDDADVMERYEYYREKGRPYVRTSIPASDAEGSRRAFLIRREIAMLEPYMAVFRTKREADARRTVQLDDGDLVAWRWFAANAGGGAGAHDDGAFTRDELAETLISLHRALYEMVGR